MGFGLLLCGVFPAPVVEDHDLIHMHLGNGAFLTGLVDEVTVHQFAVNSDACSYTGESLE